jgi:hypothetical protein
MVSDFEFNAGKQAEQKANSRNRVGSFRVKQGKWLMAQKIKFGVSHVC